VSRQAKSSRLGLFGLLALLVALAVGYLGNCFTGLGFAPGTGASAPTPAAEPAERRSEAELRARVTVQGERCRVGAEPTLGDCEAACKRVEGKTVDVEATTGAQRTVDALKSCLEGRGFKVHVVSE
jgi:hypothetical protein